MMSKGKSTKGVLSSTQAVVVDVGNHSIKVMASNRTEAMFLHALAEINPQDLDMADTGRTLPTGYAEVNGKYYAYGDHAMHFNLLRPQRSQRYTPDYYGVLFAIACTQVGAGGNLRAYVSHAPGDMRYRKNLIGSIAKRYKIRVSTGDYEIAIDKTLTFTEPYGGLCNYTLNADGTQNTKNLKTIQGATLVLDVGGVTTDTIMVLDNANILFDTFKSANVGSISYQEMFRESLLDAYKDIFRQLGGVNISSQKLHSAFLSGQFVYGQNTLDCKLQADKAKNALTNEVGRIITRIGVVNFDNCLLTGGGSSLIYPYLVKAFPQVNFIKSDEDDMQMSNMRGGYKMHRMLEVFNG
jgi:hypothetical protein